MLILLLARKNIFVSDPRKSTSGSAQVSTYCFVLCLETNAFIITRWAYCQYFFRCLFSINALHVLKGLVPCWRLRWKHWALKACFPATAKCWYNVSKVNERAFKWIHGRCPFNVPSCYRKRLTMTIATLVETTCGWLCRSQAPARGIKFLGLYKEHTHIYMCTYIHTYINRYPQAQFH